MLHATSAEHAAGTVAVSGFLLDMPQLFEDFVTIALREAIEDSHGSRVVGQSWHYLDKAGRVVLKPDIIWRVGGEVVAVVDAKYKAGKPSGFPNADLYQLLAYCTALGLRTGHLVYATGNEQPARYVVRQAGTKIICHALNLSEPPNALLMEISHLASTIAAALPSSGPGPCVRAAGESGHKGECQACSLCQPMSCWTTKLAPSWRGPLLGAPLVYRRCGQELALLQFSAAGSSAFLLLA